MTTKESLQRIQWRFSEAMKKQKGFIPNKNDVDALNEVIEYFVKSNEQRFNSNELFAKLYMWHRIELMKRYKEDIFGEVVPKLMFNYLEKPISYYIDRFTELLNEFEYVKMLENEKVPLKPSYIMKNHELINHNQKVSRFMKENPEFFEAIEGKLFDKDQVRDNIITEINQIIQVLS